MNKLDLGKKGANAANNYLQLSKSNSLAIGILLPNGKVGYFTSPGISLSSLFDIGSISKTFTAQVILKLIEEGQLSLSDTADMFFDLPKGDYPTIEALLTHTAHFWHLTPMEITIPKLLQKSYCRANVYRGIEDENVINALRKRKIAFKHRPKYSYSDFSHAILGMIASRITNKSLVELLKEIADAYSMNETYIVPKNNRVDCWIKNTKIRPWEWADNNPYIASGGIASTIKDMMKYAQGQVEQVYPFTQKAQLRYEPSFNRNSVGTCLGWHTYKSSNQCWHVGGVGTFRASMIFNSKLKCAVVVLGNAKGARSANVHYLAKLLYSEMKRHHVKIIE